MTSRPTSARDQDEGDSEFQENRFAGEDGKNNAFGSDSDGDSSEEIQRYEI